jgi:glycosyltransferase involved in cell wall biosynthesis
MIQNVAIRRYRYLPFPSAETLGLDGGILPRLRRHRKDLLKVPFLLAAQYRALARLHREHPIDILHSHWILPQGLIGGTFALRRGLPHIGTIHGSDLTGLTFPGVEYALRTAAATMDTVTVGTPFMAETLTRRVPEIDPVILPMGVEIPDAAAAVADNGATRRAIAGERPLIGFIGRLVEEKGPDIFVRVIHALREVGYDASAVIVGGGGMLETLRAMADRLGLRDHIHFAGKVPPSDVFRYLTMIDLLVVPSRREGQGLTSVEAMLSGVPVVATAVGGLTSLIDDERTGLLAPPGDVEGLVERVGRLLRNQRFANALAVSAATEARARYSARNTAARFGAIYRRALERGRR